MPLDLHEMFALDTPGLELFARTSIIYLGLLAILRFVARREAGSLEMPDLLLIVLIADGVQNAMSGEYNSVTGGLIVGGTLIFWNIALTAAAYRLPQLRRVMQPSPLPVVRNGQFIRRNMRREFITPEEILSLLRGHEIFDLGDVEEATLEPNGELSVKKRQGAPGGSASPQRRNVAAH